MASKDGYVAGMALTRFISATIEATAALLMLRLNRVDAALRINAVLGLVGPTILIVTTAVGVAGMAGKVNPSKLPLIVIGVLLIFLGTRG